MGIGGSVSGSCDTTGIAGSIGSDFNCAPSACRNCGVSGAFNAVEMRSSLTARLMPQRATQ